MLGKLLLAGVALWMAAPAGNTAKTRNIEHRLNAAMPRIPWPQTYDGPAGNSSYPYGPYSTTSGNTSFNSGNYSWPTGAGVSGPDNGNSGWPLGGAPTAHYHSIDHSHNLGTFQNDFNNLRASYSDTVTAVNSIRDSYSNTVSNFNNHIGDYQNMVSAFNVLRADHSNLLNNHNGLMFRLNASGILQ